MTHTFASVCSGIGSPEVAWSALGWHPVFASEIERFPSAVLAARFPDTPNRGDMRRFDEWPDAAIDVLVGGTPCQDFSIAGLRAGLAGDRANLALVYLEIARRYRPQWLVWENVPGVLSSNDGRDFGSILGGMVGLGYGIAYRVLDAQFFHVAQRRARVFVVGHLGDWRRAAAVLFERESLSGNPPPSREAWQGVTPPIAGCSNSGGANGPGRTADDAECLIVGDGSGVSAAVTSKWAKGSGGPAGDEHYNLVAHTLSGEGFDATEDGTGRGTPLVPVAFTCKDNGRDASHLSPTLRAMSNRDGTPSGGGQVAVAFAQNQLGEVRTSECVGTLNTNSNASGRATPMASLGSAVRRLTPRECERLQGFPDDWTLVPYRGKPAADGPRYKAIGNSMAVPVMRWIGRRIALVDGLAGNLPAARAA